MSFHHAPVSKGLMIGCATSSIIASIFDVKHYLHLQLVPHLSRHHQYWRLFAHHIAYSSSSELLLAELLLYNASIPIERMFGSAKFAAFSVTSVITATLLEFAALLLLNRLGLNVIPAGPTALVFSILYQFARVVPHAYTFKIFGITLTNKIFIYVLAFQLLISQPPGSVAASAIGLLAGQLYRTDVLGLKGFRLPRTLQRFASRFLLPLVGSTKPPRRTNRALPDDAQRQGRNAAAAAAAAAASQAVHENDEIITTAVAPPARPDTHNSSGGSSSDVGSAGIPGQSVVREWVDELTGRTERAASGLRVPSEDEISQVTNMFSNLPREDIVRALQRSPNIEAAVEDLLSTQT